MMNTDTLGPVILDIEGLTLADGEARLLKRPIVGGLILFARNYRDRDQLAALVGQVRALRPDIVIAVDQEGGRVQRFRDGFTRIPPMQVLGRACRANRDAGLELTRDCGWVMASELRSLDIDISFAPVLDLDDAHSQVIGDRSFSPDAAVATAAAAAFMEGMNQAGMATTGKHFPGHGSVRADSHLEQPVDPRPLEEVRQRDMLPFAALMAQLDAIMPAHVLFPAIDANPVGFSAYWLRTVLRGDLGFDGVIFSDDLSMAGAAVIGGYEERARRALEAGCDVILICNNPPGARAVVEALEQSRQPPSTRLARMRARQPAMPLAELEQSSRWQSTRERLEQLQAMRQ